MGASGSGPAAGDDGAREVEVDAVTALGTALSRPDGRVGTLADRAGEGPLLIVVADRRCPVARASVAALSRTGARLVVISQGRAEAAAALLRGTELAERDVLVEPSPHRVSRALAAEVVPTLALVEGLELVAWQDGWDRPAAVGLVERAGGRLDDDGGLEARHEGCPSRLGLDEQGLVDVEHEDAAGADPT